MRRVPGPAERIPLLRGASLTSASNGNKVGTRRGRPPRTPSHETYEESLDTAREIRTLIAKGTSLKIAAQLNGIGVDAARTRLRWLKEYEAKHQDGA